MLPAIPRIPPAGLDDAFSSSSRPPTERLSLAVTRLRNDTEYSHVFNYYLYA